MSVKQVQITIEPPEEHPEYMDVRAVMQRVQDFFDLLTDEAEASVVWNLESATTNSPLTVVGEPLDMRTGAGGHGLISQHVSTVERAFEAVLRDGLLPRDFPAAKRDAADRFLRSGLNGGGTAIMKFAPDQTPVTVTRKVAQNYASKTLSAEDELRSYLFKPIARREYGSIDGRIVDIRPDHSEPTVRVIESNSGREIPCRVDEASRSELNRREWGDVWMHRRVRVQGQVAYGADGHVIRVYNGKLTFLGDKVVDLDRVRDSHFTGEYSVQEYIDRLREGEFGT